MLIEIQLHAGDALFLERQAQQRGQTMTRFIECSMEAVVANLRAGKQANGYYDVVLDAADQAFVAQTEGALS